MTQPTWIGKTLRGRYRIEELLGQGGMSAVYKATDPNLGRVVAIKLIHPHLSSDPQFVRRFEEEARAVAQLRHPNIIQVYDFNHDGDVYFIVFEFVPGETLQARLQRLHQANRRLDLDQTIHIGAGLADALVYAHERGLIHRDIKPANVMLNVNNEPILMDFGIVKIIGGTQHTATGAVMGTARYMSPEQIKGERIDERTDIYSLGVMLFEMAGGQAPFEADSAMTVMMMHINDPVPDLRQLRPDVPGPIVQVINQALAKDRANRFQRVGAIAMALRSIDPAVPPAAPEVTMLDSKPEATIVDNSTSTPEPPTYEATVVDSTPASGLPAAAAAGTTRRTQEPAVPPAVPPAAPPPGGRDSAAAVLPGAPAGPLAGQRNKLLAAGAALLALVLIAGILFATGAIGGNGDDGTPVAGALATDEAAGVAADATGSPTATATTSPTPSPSSTTPPTATVTSSPTPTTAASAESRSARINSITVDNERYVVQYETFEFTEALPGMHVHFFFDTVPPAQAGVPGAGPWFVYGGPRPFTGYTLADRPTAAQQMCILVANADHSVQPGSGNCVDLPPASRASATATPAPTVAAAPTATNTAPPPTATVPPEPSARINSITVDNDRYVVAYETFEYTEALPGMHVHFFFDTVPPAQAGVPGGGPWFVYGGPRPFTGYTLADRPAGAQQMCILVANADHSVRANSGNCVNLPP